MEVKVNQTGNIGLVIIIIILLLTMVFGAGGYFLGWGKQFIAPKTLENANKEDTNKLGNPVVNNNPVYTPPPILQYKT